MRPATDLQGWITEGECAARVGVPEEAVRNLISIGAVNYIIGPELRPLVFESEVRLQLAFRSVLMLSDRQGGAE